MRKSAKADLRWLAEFTIGPRSRGPVGSHLRVTEMSQ